MTTAPLFKIDIENSRSFSTVCMTMEMSEFIIEGELLLLKDKFFEAGYHFWCLAEKLVSAALFQRSGEAYEKAGSIYASKAFTRAAFLFLEMDPVASNKLYMRSLALYKKNKIICIEVAEIYFFVALNMPHLPENRYIFLLEANTIYNTLNIQHKEIIYHLQALERTIRMSYQHEKYMCPIIKSYLEKTEGIPEEVYLKYVDEELALIRPCMSEFDTSSSISVAQREINTIHFVQVISILLMIKVSGERAGNIYLMISKLTLEYYLWLNNLAIVLSSAHTCLKAYSIFWKKNLEKTIESIKYGEKLCDIIYEIGSESMKVESEKIYESFFYVTMEKPF